jgi:3-hydroxybutyryl-CoA dehydrogenase
MKNINVAIIGSGTMGMGIAQLSATMGNKTYLYDIEQNALEKAEEFINKMLQKLVDKNKLTEHQYKSISEKINYTSELNDIADAEMVIEAIVEDPDVKKKVFSDIEKIVSYETILASNTSSLSIAAISSALKKPERMLGIHFFNPAPLMPLVEIVPSLLTNRETVNKSKEIIDLWGKKTVIAKDTPGFIVNRIARPFYGEALRIYEEGIADITQIDSIMKELGNFRMGPFELMDLIGNDVNYAVNEKVFEQTYFDQRYKPSITQKRYVEAGLYGRKTKRGFYNYNADSTSAPLELPENIKKEIFYRILAMLINEAADALRLNIAKRDDIETAMQNGVNYPKGLLKWCDDLGADFIYKKLNELFIEYGEDRYRPSPLLRKMAEKKSKFF